MMVENPMVIDSSHAGGIAIMLDKDHNCTLANHVMASPLFGQTERDLIHEKYIHEVDSGNSAETLSM